MEIVDYQVIDGWHPDADAIRQQALEMPFTVYGNYPGVRTPCCWPLRDYAKGYLSSLGFSIRYWPTQYNGAFQLCTQEHKTWVHSDDTGYAAVWFLTPGELCPEGHGTAFYRHVATNSLRSHGRQQHAPFDESYEQHLFVEGLFNRLLIYDARLYHASTLAGFGDHEENGRLTATFFWN
ncbi:MAG: hypothetical protein F4X17_16375 [Gemmatimonadetes bacterium]|nr:hypothetical protein [Gemmatimonadota bacterium]